MTVQVEPIEESLSASNLGKAGELRGTEIRGIKTLVWFDGVTPGGHHFGQGFVGEYEHNLAANTVLEADASAEVFSFKGAVVSNQYSGGTAWYQNLPGPDPRLVAWCGPKFGNNLNANTGWECWTRDNDVALDEVEYRFGVLTTGEFRFGDIQVQLGTTSTYFEVNGTDFRIVAENTRSITLSTANFDVFSCTTAGNARVHTGRTLEFGANIRLKQGGASDWTLIFEADGIRGYEFKANSNIFLKMDGQTSRITIIGLPVYTNNTTASAALSTGMLYRTALGVVMQVY